MHLRASALNVEWFCSRYAATFNKSVENMMSIKSFVEIKESAAAPWPLRIGFYLHPRSLQTVQPIQSDVGSISVPYLCIYVVVYRLDAGRSACVDSVFRMLP